jgi:hypothetical protein
LAQASAVRAFPTFHFYRRGMRVDELTGADTARLLHILTTLQGGDAADGDAALPSQEVLVAAVARALATLKANCTFDEFVTGTRTMLTFVGNCVKDPSNPKFRKVRVSNATFHSRLGRHTGGRECMQSFGFTSDVEDDGEETLVVSEPKARNPALVAVRDLLASAIPAQSAAAPPAAAPGTVLPTPGVPVGGGGGFPGLGAGLAGMGGLGGLGGMGGMGGTRTAGTRSPLVRMPSRD